MATASVSPPRLRIRLPEARPARVASAGATGVIYALRMSGALADHTVGRVLGMFGLDVPGMRRRPASTVKSPQQGVEHA